jgi:hypothetical protein
MLMSAAGIRHVHLLVAEHERAIAFYEATRTTNTGSDRRIDLAAPAVAWRSRPSRARWLP